MDTNDKRNRPLPKYVVKPNKLLGQNFLVDKSVLHQIVSTADLSKEDTVLEVGPGTGLLTQELVQRAGQVIAIEKDRKLAFDLKEKFRDTPNLKIVEGDVLKFLDFGIEELIGDWKVVANIPYYLTAILIRKLLEGKNPPSDMVLMVQKEVAQRICARPPRLSLLAVSVQFYAQAKIIAKVSRHSFKPKPKVDSAIIKITPRDEKINDRQRKSFFRLVKAGFSQPRKQLANNLSTSLKIKRDEVNFFIKKAGLKPEQRAGHLSLDDWLKLTDVIFTQK